MRKVEGLKYSPIRRPPGTEPEDHPGQHIKLSPGVWCSHNRVLPSEEYGYEDTAPSTPAPFPPVPSGATINATKYNDMMLRSMQEMNAGLDDGESSFTPESYEEFQLSFGADQSPQSSTKRNRKAPMCVRPVKRSRAKLESEFGASSTVESPSPAREESYCV